MTVHIAVLDPLPMFRRGVAAVLTAEGYTTETPTEPAEWTPRAESSVALLSLCVERDWAQLRRVCDGYPGLAVIALLEEEIVSAGVRAIRAGARSVLSRGVGAEALERAVHVTVGGQAVMPAAVATALAAGGAAGAVYRGSLSSEQLLWLRQLADGTTVATLAIEVGYSERAMYRLLRSLYRQLGVRNRVQAILLAQQQGWFAAEAENQ